jgi:hypothetical protein
VFNAVLCMCVDYKKDLMDYIEYRHSKSRLRLTISWLKPLRLLYDADIKNVCTGVFHLSWTSGMVL